MSNYNTVYFAGTVRSFESKTTSNGNSWGIGVLAIQQRGKGGDPKEVGVEFKAFGGLAEELAALEGRAVVLICSLSPEEWEYNGKTSRKLALRVEHYAMQPTDDQEESEAEKEKYGERTEDQDIPF